MSAKSQWQLQVRCWVFVKLLYTQLLQRSLSSCFKQAQSWLFKLAVVEIREVVQTLEIDEIQGSLCEILESDRFDRKRRLRSINIVWCLFVQLRETSSPGTVHFFSSPFLPICQSVSVNTYVIVGLLDM
jgi:hypothetical protein